jgi:cytochrome c oxidase cbb3-type subunit III
MMSSPFQRYQVARFFLPVAVYLGAVSLWATSSLPLLPVQRGQNLKPESLERRDPGVNGVDPTSIETGAKLFVGSCSICHGIDGRGGARGPDLTQGLVVNRGTDDEVAQVIRKGVPGSSMAAFDFPDSQVQQLVAFIRSLSIKAAQLSLPGDLEAGRQVFFGKGRCYECHMIRGQGGLLGPELSNLGNERTLSEIRQSILQPGVVSDGKYKLVTVVTRSGEKITGVLRNRDNFSLQMADQHGRLRFFLTSELSRLETHEKSLMPNNYETLFRPEELQNLLAYLSRQTVAAAGQKEEGKMKKAQNANVR